jgi:hypothetical protein
VIPENGKLMLQAHPGQKLELEADKENYFFDLFEGNEGDVQFVTGNNGKVDKTALPQNRVSISGEKNLSISHFLKS